MQKHPLVRPTARSQQAAIIDPATGRRKHSSGTQHVSAAFPFIADLKNGTSYAAWKVWSGSTTKQVRFVPLPRKVAARLYHKAVGWNRRGKLAGRHGGLIGSHVLLVLHTLIFDFLNHKTGRLDPSYSTIQKATRLCRQTVAKALARLAQLGILNWQRRSRPHVDQLGGFILLQETNAYAILPSSQWHGYVDNPEPEAPHPTTWGASPPLPSLIEQATADARDGDSMKTIVSRLDADPLDRVASSLASLFRSVGEVKS